MRETLSLLAMAGVEPPVTLVTSAAMAGRYPSRREEIAMRHLITAVVCLAGSAFMAFSRAHGLY